MTPKTLIDTDVLSAVMRLDPNALARSKSYLSHHSQLSFSLIPLSHSNVPATRRIIKWIACQNSPIWRKTSDQSKTMNEEELRVAVLTEPFEPKRIYLSDGTTVDIPRSGTIAVGRRTSGMVIDGLVHTISNLHITRIEPLVTAPRE